MPFKYNPPTRKTCSVCEEIAKESLNPIVDNHSGKASSANNFPFHNWYNFVLGYSPEFPEYLINKENITSKHLVVDPFMGTGTTNVLCKEKNIESIGLEANDYFINVAKTKLTWNIDLKKINKISIELLEKVKNHLSKIDFEINDDKLNSDLFSDVMVKTKKKSYKTISNKRPIELLEKYLCDRPYTKLQVIQNSIFKIVSKEDIEILNFFNLALSSIIVPSSNISYGPGFGVKKPKVDVDVFKLFEKKVSRMMLDLEEIKDSKNKNTKFKIIHGDSREMSKYLAPNSVDFMITSPPYPGDHEYTKHTKLELIFEDHAKTLKEFRVIKKRMLTGSTTNIYKEDNDREYVKDNLLITQVTDLIQERLIEDNATSGFEKLYTKLVWEYFGGMAMVFKEALQLLKKGGKFSLLVSDSHAFKMVHIRTAFILKDIALKEGFSNAEIELWQNKKSTSHKYNLREEILTVTK
jgi:DNA modification methylase|tara:strand:- start:725 stop:2122 length:1398 start_codon:yes stop_codon:yes gene_type:complete